MTESEFLPSVTVDVIAWERVQFILAGRFRNIDPQAASFVLINRDTREKVVLDNVATKDDRFVVKMNIVTVYGDRSNLPTGCWDVAVISGAADAIFPVTVNPKLYAEDKQSGLGEMPQEDALEQYAGHFKKSVANSYSLIPRAATNDCLYIETEHIRPVKKGVLAATIKELKKLFGPIVEEVLRLGFYTVFGIASLFARHKGNRLLFCSDSRAELSGNMEDVYNRMVERDLIKNYKVSFLFKKNVKARRNIFEKFRAPILLALADIILLDDFNPTIKLVKLKPSVKVIQLWHACGAFKTVGFSRLGKRGGPVIHSTNHRMYTHAIASSSHVAQFYCEAFGMTPDMVFPTGVPRTDVFFDEQYRQDTRAAMLEAVPIANGKRVILFAPTFRGNGAKSGHYPLSVLDLKTIATLCRHTNSVFLFKLHPFIRDKVIIPEEYADVIADLSEEREINDLLFITDLLITDYSSVVYEASILSIPMLFFAYDLEEYISSRDFYEPFESFVPGKIVRDFDEMVKAILEGDFEAEKVEPFCEKNFEYQDGKSTDRVIDWLILGNPPEKTTE